MYFRLSIRGPFRKTVRRSFLEVYATQRRGILTSVGWYVSTNSSQSPPYQIVRKSGRWEQNYSIHTGMVKLSVAICFGQAPETAEDIRM